MDHPVPLSAREVLDRILADRTVIGDLLLNLGVRDVVTIVAAVEVFETVVCELGGHAAYDFDRNDDLPLVDVDARRIAAHHGLAYDGQRTEAAIDALCEGAAEFFLRRAKA